MATKLDLAEQQIYGFCIGRNNNLRELINSMGLTKREWEKIKYSDSVRYLNIRDIDEIEQIVNK